MEEDGNATQIARALFATVKPTDDPTKDEDQTVLTQKIKPGTEGTQTVGHDVNKSQENNCDSTRRSTLDTNFTAASLLTRYGSGARESGPAGTHGIPPKYLSLNYIFEALKTHKYLYDSHELADFLKKIEHSKFQIDQNILDKLKALTSENSKLKLNSDQLKSTNSHLENVYKEERTKYETVIKSIQNLYFKLESYNLIQTSSPHSTHKTDNTINYIKIIDDCITQLYNDNNIQKCKLKCKAEESDKIKLQLTECTNIKEAAEVDYNRKIKEQSLKYDNQLLDLKKSCKSHLDSNKQQETTIKEKTAEYNKILLQLSDAKLKNIDLEKRIKETEIDHKLKLQKEHNKYKELKENSEASILDYENRIEVVQRTLESEKLKYKGQLADWTNKFNEQLDINEKQENEIIHKTEEYKKLQRQILEGKQENTNLTKSLEEMQKSHEKILQKEYNKYTELKRSKEATETEYENTIREKRATFERQKRNYDKRIADLQSGFDSQVDQTEAVLKEKRDLVIQAAKEKRDLEKRLEQSKTETQMTFNELHHKHLNLEREKTFRTKLQQQSHNFLKAIHMQENDFAKNKENFKNRLEGLFKNFEKYTQKLSIEDLERESENTVIEQVISKIDQIQNSVSKYEDQIQTFRGNTKNKTYLDIREMLIRAIEKLDVIESQRRTKIQIKRKEAINYIKDLQDQLERKVTK